MKNNNMKRRKAREIVFENCNSFENRAILYELLNAVE